MTRGTLSQSNEGCSLVAERHAVLGTVYVVLLVGLDV